MNTQNLTTSREVTDSTKPIAMLALQSTVFDKISTFEAGNDLAELEAKVLRQPQDLKAHIDRINHCVQMEQSEQLYAALIDMLIVLNRQGPAISWRMLNITKAKLSGEQQKTLSDYLRNTNTDSQTLPITPHSLFSKGLAESNLLVQALQTASQDNLEQDVLRLARDYIIASEFNKAQDILEKAIMKQPSRLDLHHELLELYHSIHNFVGFNRMFSKLTRLGFTMPDEWGRLHNYFKGLSEHG